MFDSKKYSAFSPISLTDRKWADKTITAAPVWCSVDLRDGNQALVEPMNPFEKIQMFKLLCDLGFKEIEVGFPSANDTEYELVRQLIEQNLIPDDVTIQVLVQSREHLIRKTFDAIKGAKRVNLHFYNSIGEFQQKVVFKTDRLGVIKMAVDSAKLIRKLANEARADGTDIIYEYSPEHFSGSDVDFAVEICDAVIGVLDDINKVIINLPSTVECSTPNCFADQVEYFCRNLKNRDRAVISIHTHNDRGTAVAAAELGILAGADRVEGTLFGNGERTGNVDIITLALNLFSCGIDPKIDLSDINYVKSVYEQITGMTVGPRHPYAGELVFTAFSGSHQDAINKGLDYYKEHSADGWNVPYLPVDPADLGRKYEPIIRINSQSGKGGAAFIMANDFGYSMPKTMHADFGQLVNDACVKKGSELTKNEIFDLFEKEYVDINSPLTLVGHKFREESTAYGGSTVYIEVDLDVNGTRVIANGEGNGPIDAFFNALSSIDYNEFKFISYHEHAITSGSDSRAIAYIELQDKNGNQCFGVGISHNINLAPIRGIISAINRTQRK